MDETDGFEKRAVITVTLVYSAEEFDRLVRRADALMRRHSVPDFSDLFRKLVDDANDPR